MPCKSRNEDSKCVVHDVAGVTSARPCTRVLPFVVGCPAAPAVDDFQGREDPTMSTARVVHDHIWGAAWPAETDEAATLAAALQWRKAGHSLIFFSFQD